MKMNFVSSNSYKMMRCHIDPTKKNPFSFDSVHQRSVLRCVLSGADESCTFIPQRGQCLLESCV